MRDAIIAGGVILVVVLALRIADGIGWAFTNYQTSSAMWLLAGVVLGLGGAGLIVAANAIQDGVRAGMYDRSGGRGRTVDVMPGAQMPPLKDYAAVTNALANARHQDARTAEVVSRTTVPAFSPGEFRSNGFSGLPWEQSE